MERAAGAPKSVPAEVEVMSPHPSELLNALSGTTGLLAVHSGGRRFLDSLVAVGLGGGARPSMLTGRDVLADGSDTTKGRDAVLERNPGGSSSYLGLCARPLHW